MSNNIFFTSDNHFYHRSILKFAAETRKNHVDVSAMNAEMIEIWNSQVTDKDTVFMLGDFSFGNTKNTEEILRQLKGKFHLIKGNHDKWLNTDIVKYFESVNEYKKIRIQEKDVILFHYPIREWQNVHRGSYHLYGHVHGSVLNGGRSMDVGIDARPQKDMGLWLWEEIDELLKDREILTHHGKIA